MREMKKFVLLVRLNVAWPLSEWRPIDLEEVDAMTWRVVYQHRWSGDMKTSGLLKSELDRAEMNQYGGRFRWVVSALRDEDGVVLSARKQPCRVKKVVRW
jgi:hypothetical protein